MKKMLSLVLVISLCIGMLTGCEGLKQKLDLQEKKEVETANLNEPVSLESKWINSEIEGAIDENSQLNLKDDFYSAYNKEWLINTKADDLHMMVHANKSNEITDRRLLGIIKNETDADATGDAPVPAEYVSHDEKQVRILSDALMDWDARNKTGMSDLKKYTDYIEAINSVDDVKEYFIGNNGENLKQLGLVGMTVFSPRIDAEHYYVYLEQISSVSLPEAAYHGAPAAAASMKTADEHVGYILRRLGYSDREVKDIFTRCYKFESGMVDQSVAEEYFSNKFLENKESTDTISLEELQKIEGNYPLTDIIKAYGYDKGNLVALNTNYIKYVGKQIREDNLDNIKAFLLVNTVLDTDWLLDQEAYDYFTTLKERDSKIDKDEVARDVISDIDKYYLHTVQEYLQGALDTVYVARYCKQEEKEDLTKLTKMYVDKLREMFNDEDWISDETKANAIEKLDAIQLNILYPDNFISYDYINLTEGNRLIDLVAEYNAGNRGAKASLLAGNVDRTRWDMNDYKANTTYYNAGYRPNVNSISIFDGYIADKTYYSMDMSIEEKFAKIGTVIGHELTHAFDKNGAQYDKYGYKSNWWMSSDLAKFDTRNTKIGVYYHSLHPYPGKSYGATDSVKVEGEVAADLGGIKCSLELGKELDSFDNKAFFEYFVEGYREKVTPEGARYYDGDAHPINCIRTNVDIMQFDEFQEAFDIHEGDGMYIAPENRITVW